MTFTTERQQELRDFWPLGQPIRVLADQWHCTVGYISSRAKVLGLPSRQPRRTSYRLFRVFFESAESRSYLLHEAERRNLPIRDLEISLLQTIANDKLVGAILDDEDQLIKSTGEGHGRRGQEGRG